MKTAQGAIVSASLGFFVQDITQPSVRDDLYRAYSALEQGTVWPTFLDPFQTSFLLFPMLRFLCRYKLRFYILHFFYTQGKKPLPLIIYLFTETNCISLGVITV